MFQRFQGCFARKADGAQISHSSSRCVEWRENWPEAPQRNKKRGTKSAVHLERTIKVQNLEPRRESGGKNTHIKSAEGIEMSIKIHLLFHTLHQFSANGEQITLKSQTEE